MNNNPGVPPAPDSRNSEGFLVSPPESASQPEVTLKTPPIEPEKTANEILPPVQEQIATAPPIMPDTQTEISLDPSAQTEVGKISPAVKNILEQKINEEQTDLAGFDDLTTTAYQNTEKS